MKEFNLPALQDKLTKDISLFTNREKIEVAEYFLMHHVEGSTTESPPLRHFLANGTYAREITLPTGYLLTGKVHKFEHVSILSKGAVTIMTDDGIEHIKAPHTWISPVGTKRLIYVHEETIWTTIHKTDATSAEGIELELTEESDLTWIDEQKLLPGGIK